jgi:hypothetical protein
MSGKEWTSENLRVFEGMRRAHYEVVAAWRTVAGSPHGATFTHGVDGTRGDFVGQSNRFGLDHLEEFADFLFDVLRKNPEAFYSLLRSRAILDLNAGAALNSVFLAYIARQLVNSSMLISVIEHAPAALELALELASALDVRATPHLVEKSYESVTSTNPDATDRLIGATLSPPLRFVDGDLVIFAGHAMNCHRFTTPMLQQNLDAQNEAVLGLVARAVDAAATVRLLQIDIRWSGTRKVGFISSALAQSGLPCRARDFFIEGWPVNRTNPTGQFKYAALAVLGPQEVAQICVNGADEVLLTSGELEGMFGRPLPVWGDDGLVALDRLFGAEVSL